MPLKVSWLSLVSLLLWTAGNKEHASEFEGQEWGCVSKIQRFGGSWAFFLKMQINGKEKSAVFGWIYTEAGAGEVWLYG